MTQVIELEQATLVEAADRGTRVVISISVATTSSAGNSALNTFDVRTSLDGEAYPALVAVWDNDDDAVFDEL